MIQSLGIGEQPPSFTIISEDHSPAVVQEPPEATARYTIPETDAEPDESFRPVVALPEDAQTKITPAEERNLLAAIQGDDQKQADRAFGDLFSAHAPSLERFLFGITSPGLGQDLIQEVAIKAFKSIRHHQLAMTGDSIRPWLFTVARHVAIDYARAEKRRPVTVPLDSQETPYSERVDPIDVEGMVIGNHNVETLLEALGKIKGEEAKALIIARILDDLTVAQTAEKLDIPPGTVKSRTHYALGVLARIALK